MTDYKNLKRFEKSQINGLTKHLASLTDEALVREYHRIRAKIDKALRKLIKLGLGDVKPSDMMRGRDTTYANNKTVRDYLALTNYASEIKSHAKNRYGPGLIIIDQLIWNSR